MAYGKAVFDAAMARVAARRQAAEAENTLAKQQLYQKIPRLSRIEQELAETGLSAVRAILTTGDAKTHIDLLRKKNLALQEERASLLRTNGYPDTILDVNFYCPVCHDTGFTGDKICECLRALLREEACRRANDGSPLPLFSFSGFSLDYYPETALRGQDVTIRSWMSRVLQYCRNYAASFPGNGQSLLLLGGTGLGKTHLALSIANSVIERGFGVVYDTAQNIFSRLEDENFGRAEKRLTATVLDCDLLILDDLPDYASPYAVNALYNLVNTRSLARRPVVISTNLTENELSQKYGGKIFSRLIGDFVLLKFFGSDIRQLKLMKKE